jgi:FkbM family methyltransferase
VAYSAFIRCLPRDFRLVLADIGSAGGLHGRWREARPVLSAMMFEPRSGGAVRQEGQDRIYPVALAAEAGTVTLNVTALANMSSTRKPNAELLRHFRKKGAHAEVTSALTLPADTLDAVAARDGIAVDAIKADTQGSELDILRGARQALARSVIFAEVEVSFLERYSGQPLAADVIQFMKREGFELLDLSRLKRYRRTNTLDIANASLGGGQRAGQLAYCDAVFMRSEASLLLRMKEWPAEAEALALKTLLLLLVYGKLDIAAAFLDASRGAIEGPRAAAIDASLRALKRRRIWTGWTRKLFDYLARHA